MAIERDHLPEGVAHVRVVGVGGAGGNALRTMVKAGVRGVEFLAINTDAQALAHVGVEDCVRIGEKLTRGLGAGGNPEIGLRAAEESRDNIRAALAGADMVFITAGMGGGTGTGASPAIAMTARELGILTVGIVSTPFAFEGQPRRRVAERGLAALREQVDTLIVVPNERLIKLAGKTMRMSEAYALADDVLRQGVQAISDLIAVPGHINLDFADVRTVMSEAGSALMSVGQASGEERATEALRAALTNPMLDLDITGARAVLVNVTAGPDLMVHEVGAVVESLRERIYSDANVVFGTVDDPSFDGQIKVTLVATGFEPRVSHAMPGAAARVAGGSAHAGTENQRRAGDQAHLAATSPRTAPAGREVAADQRAASGLHVVPPAQEREYVRGDALGAWDEPRVACDGRGPSRLGGARGREQVSATSELDDADEPRVGQAQIRPANQPADMPYQPGESGFRGIDLPGFFHRRR